MSTAFDIIRSDKRTHDGRQLFLSAAFWITLDRPRRMIWQHDTVERFNRATHSDFMEFVRRDALRAFKPYHLCRLLWVLASVDDPAFTLSDAAGFATQRTWDELRTKLDNLVLILRSESGGLQN